MKKFTTYSFDLHDWITGEDAKELAIRQHKTHIAFLQSPTGKAYWEQTNRDSEQAIAHSLAEIERISKIA
jgi:hypothetical protein